MSHDASTTGAGQGRSLKPRTTVGAHVPAAPAPRLTTAEERARVRRAMHRRVWLARRSGAAFNEAVLRHEQTHKRIQNGGHHEQWHVDMDRCNRLVAWAHVESGKAVPLDTPIPTPAGWRTMGDLRVGDEVFGSDGRACRVTMVTGTMVDHVVYRVRFDDGDEQYADAEHQWSARDDDAAWRTVTTETMRTGRWEIPVAGAADYPEARLPVPPSVLGARLARGVGGEIPELYLLASRTQRMALWAGLCGDDAEGEVQCGSGRFATDVLELARSLGFKARLAGAAVLFERATSRSIVAIEEVPSVPVRCISVDSPNHTYLMGRSYTVTHNTQQITVGRVLYELGRNPNLRIAIVSETHGKAAKILRSIKSYIRNSKDLHRVFPHLKRSSNKDDPWTATSITVERANTGAKDASIQITGAGGSIIGSRVDLLVLDDILSHRNTRTKAQREKLTDWYNSNLGGRLTDDARVIAVGTAWDPEDLYHELAKKPGWQARRYGVINQETGLPNWPEVWSLTRIANARAQLGPVEAMRQLDVLPVDSLQSRFQKEFIERSLAEGNGYSLALSLSDLLGPGEELPEGAYFTTGIDVGASFKPTGGLTVAFTTLNYKNGDRQIVAIEAGRMSGPDILALARSHHQRYGSVVYVENNGAQQFLLQWAEQGEYFPVLAHHTGANKWHPAFGVESLAIEMSQGRWLFPNDGGVMHPELAALIAEMKSYSPDAHTGDRIMAMWIAREGARKSASGMAPQMMVRSFDPVDGARPQSLEEMDDEEFDEQWS